MQTTFEHYATTSMLGAPDSPPRCNAELTFHRAWEARVFGLALALSREGYFEWETFRLALIDTIAEWEKVNGTDRVNPDWDYYRCWLSALEQTLIASDVLSADELARAVRRMAPTGR